MSLKPKPPEEPFRKIWTADEIKYWGDILGPLIYEVQDVRQVPDVDAFDVIFKDRATIRVSGQQLAAAEKRWQNVNS